MTDYVTLEGYSIRRTTDKAIGLVKEGVGRQGNLIWIPRSCCRDGDTLETFDTDIEVQEWKAEELGLIY